LMRSLAPLTVEQLVSIIGAVAAAAAPMAVVLRKVLRFMGCKLSVVGCQLVSPERPLKSSISSFVSSLAGK